MRKVNQKKRRVKQHLMTMKWFLSSANNPEHKYNYKKGNYYFEKQIEVAEKLLRQW